MTKTIKLTPAISNKPCDIEYRLKRAAALANECAQFLCGIDSTAFQEAGAHSTATETASELTAMVERLRSAAPTKRIHGTKAKAAAGVVDAPKALKGRRGRKVSAESTPLPSTMVALDDMLNDAIAE